METILLLHGALGSKEELLPLERTLSVDFIVHAINFHGHAGEPAENNFSIEYFTRQVLDWMSEREIDSINIVGYSLGGFVGLYLAHNYPEKIKKLVTIGTKLHWEPSVAEKEIARLDPETIEKKAPAFAEALKKRHSPENWKAMVGKFAEMLRHMGQFNPVKLEDFSKIQTPVLLILGDRDKLVTFVETTTAYRELPHGQFAVLPNTPHSITEINVGLTAVIIKTFLLQ